MNPTGTDRSGAEQSCVMVAGMSVFSKVRNFLARRRPKPLNEWFFVSFDEKAVHLRAQPPGKPAWSQDFAWDTVIRVCFKAEDMFMSDGIYVFTSTRPESYVIPTEAHGGGELWSEILRRKLFDAALAIEAARSTGGLYCWPPESPATRPAAAQATTPVLDRSPPCR